MSEFAIKTENLTKNYGPITANDNVTVNIKKGSIYGLIGRNGAGKTTFMRMLLGLTPKTSGYMELLGHDEKTINAARAKTGFIIENPCFYENMSAFDNLMIRAKMIGLKSPKEQIMAALKQVGLEGKEKFNVKKYSLGMRQILGIAYAILGNPELLILDEPVNGLDPIAIVKVRELLLDLNKKGSTILISSHILGEIQKLCTCYGFILGGKLVKEISEEEVKNSNIDLEKLFVEMAKEEK